jgi:lipoprotein-releasing system permease protein
MIFERFMATRLAAGGPKSFTRLIIQFAIAAVTISLAVMIVAVSMISGFKNEISSKIFGFWGHIHITDTRADRSYEAWPINKNQDFVLALDSIGYVEYLTPLSLGGYDLGDNLIEKRTQGGVRHVQSFAQSPGIIRTKDQIEGIILKGVGKDFDWDYIRQFIRQGTTLDVFDTIPSDGIIISEQTARRLEVELGDRFRVYFVRENQQIQRRFEVQGVFKTGLEDYDQKFALVDIRKIQQLLHWSEDQVAGFEVFVDNIDEAEIINEYVYVEELPPELYSQTIRQKFPNIFEWLELQNINEYVILTLTLVVAIINMITALLILILERTNMIGILKALGSSNWQIKKIFLIQSARIISKGLLWGNIIGIGLCLVQKYFKIIKLNEADYYLSYAPIHLNPWGILTLNATTLVITLLFLIIPSMLIARISPVRAIQFK